MKNKTFIYLWRSILQTSFYKNPLTCRLAVHLILSVAWKDHKVMIGGKEVLIKRGQVPTGRIKLAEETGLSERNIRTSLKHLEKCGFLTIKSTNVCSIITICKYNEYQTLKDKCRPADRPATDQPPTSDRPLQNEGYKGNEVKTKVSSKKLDYPYQEIISYLNNKTNKNFKHTSKETQKLIKARINQGFTIADFQAVIDRKSEKWLTDPKMVDYLRPQTLFGTKFESYLNETDARPSVKTLEGDDALYYEGY
jgi:uncharacterized phage protein (TIGR02220 family)